MTEIDVASQRRTTVIVAVVTIEPARSVAGSRTWRRPRGSRTVIDRGRGPTE